MKSPDPAGPPKGKVKKFLAGFGYALWGLKFAVGTQCNIRVQLGLAAVALIAAWLLDMPRAEVAILVLTITVVLAAELFNTAVETCVDLVSPEYNTLARLTKDVSAGAVLVCAVGAGVIGLMLFVPAVWKAVS